MLWNPYLELLLLRLCFSVLEFRLSFPFFLFISLNIVNIFILIRSGTFIMCIPWTFIFLVNFFLLYIYVFYSSYTTLILHDCHTWDIKTKYRNNFKPLMFFLQKNYFASVRWLKQVKIIELVCFHIYAYSHVTDPSTENRDMSGSFWFIFIHWLEVVKIIG